MHEGNGERQGLQTRRRRTSELNKYYSLEKRLASSGALSTLWNCSEAFSSSNSGFYHHVAGWALAESALVATESPQGERGALLEMAKWEWQAARDIQQEKDVSENKSAYQHFLKSPELIRVESTLAAADVFEAMIDGDITPESRESYYEKTLELAVRASDGSLACSDEGNERPREADNYIGIAHELNSMLVINRLKSPTIMAFPSLARSDSGINYPSQTHDINLFNMKWGEIVKSLPVEVKTTPQEMHFDRYEAIIIGGTMHLHPDNQRDPAYLTELLVKEHKNILQPEELTILDAITDNTFHAARHGFADINQCRNQELCTSIPATRHTHREHV